MRRTARRHIKPRPTITRAAIARRAKLASVAAGVGLLTASLSVGVWEVVGDTTHGVGSGDSVALPSLPSTSAAPSDPSASTLPSTAASSSAAAATSSRATGTQRVSRSETRPQISTAPTSHPAAPAPSTRRTTIRAAASTPATKPSTAAPSTSQPAAVAASDPAAAYEARILTLVNAERTSRGLAPLQLSSCAAGFAEKWSAHMAATADFSHQSLSPLLSSCGATRAAENIAEGDVTADQMMQMWMNSPGHRANILDPALTHIGIGAVRAPDGTWWATQDFLTL